MSCLSQSPSKGSGGISLSALTLTKSIMQRTCATTATIEKVRPRWLMLADILSDRITQAECARTVTSQSTT
jgi:hypothetical protein